MSNHHTYKKIELVGSSKTSIEDAINNALAEAAKSIQHLEWFEVVDTRGHIENGAVGHYQVTLKVGSVSPIADGTLETCPRSPAPWEGRRVFPLRRIMHRL